MTNGRVDMFSYTFEAIGTHWQIDIYEQLALQERERLLSDIMARIHVFDVAYSRFREDSLVTTMSRAAGTYALPMDAEPMLKLYHALYTLTEGAFTPLIGQTLVEAGYDATYSLKSKELHTPPTWDEVLSWDTPNLTIKKPALLDFGAAGKGYLIDLVGEVLEDNSVHSFCIDAGGDILHRRADGELLRVGLEHPADLSQVVGVATIGNQSICGSAGNRRAWQGFHHTINPHTLTSPQHILATWTVAPSTMLADALSTCLYFIPAEKLRAHYHFEYLVLRADYSVETSSNFPAELFVSTASPDKDGMR